MAGDDAVTSLTVILSQRDLPGEVLPCSASIDCSLVRLLLAAASTLRRKTNQNDAKQAPSSAAASLVLLLRQGRWNVAVTCCSASFSPPNAEKQTPCVLLFSREFFLLLFCRLLYC